MSIYQAFVAKLLKIFYYYNEPNGIAVKNVIRLSISSAIATFLLTNQSVGLLIVFSVQHNQEPMAGMHKQESSTLNSCIRAQKLMWMPNATHYNDCVKLFTGRGLEMSPGVILQHDNATPTQHTLDTSCHFSGNFWTIHPVVLTLPSLTTTCLVHWSHNIEEVDNAVQEWLQMQEPNFCHDGIFELVSG
jgi:hypothetical protein